MSDNAAEKQQFTLHTSMQELVDQYDGFILDQFGVLHNGKVGLPGAPEAVERLFEKGKKLIILSNSSSSSESCKAKLPSLGYNPSHFVSAPVTSGQEAGQYIREEYGSDDGSSADNNDNTVEKKKALLITWKTPPKLKSPQPFLELFNVEITDQTDEADFVILHGVDVLCGPGADGEAVETSLGDFLNDGKFDDKIDPLLKKCAAHNLPMICCNPDFIMVKPTGEIGHMPGKIAERYENKYKGSVKSFGKPHREHFEACLKKLNLPKDRVAHVGDSLHHDVAGANAAGISSIFVTGGIHCDELKSSTEELGTMTTTATLTLPHPDKLQKLFDQHQQTPTHVLPMFRF